MKRDISQAEAFIFTLTGHPQTPVTFQVFDDEKDRKSKNLSRVLHGTLEQQLPKLIRYNDDGAGIFLAINETNLRGRCMSDIVRIRCLVSDKDNGVFSTDLSPTPTMRVESSPGKEHAYWVLREPSTEIHRFEILQKRIAAKFATDPSVSDASRVMRVPGFLHMKDSDSPALVRITHKTNFRYSLDELADHFPLSLAENTQISGPRESIANLIIHGVPEGGRNNTLTKIVGHLLGKRVDQHLVALLAHSINKTNFFPPLDQREVSRVVESITKREMEKREQSRLRFAEGK
jgi:hypothetical protein